MTDIKADWFNKDAIVSLKLLYFPAENCYRVSHITSGLPEHSVIHSWEVSEARAIELAKEVAETYRNYYPRARSLQPRHKGGGKTDCFKTTKPHGVIKFITDRIDNAYIDLYINTDMVMSTGEYRGELLFKRSLPYHVLIECYRTFNGENPDKLDEIAKVIRIIKEGA
jgi:hypothetical protein